VLRHSPAGSSAKSATNIACSMDLQYVPDSLRPYTTHDSRSRRAPLDSECTRLRGRSRRRWLAGHAVPRFSNRAARVLMMTDVATARVAMKLKFQWADTLVATRAMYNILRVFSSAECNAFDDNIEPCGQDVRPTTKILPLSLGVYSQRSGFDRPRGGVTCVTARRRLRAEKLCPCPSAPTRACRFGSRPSGSSAGSVRLRIAPWRRLEDRQRHVDVECASHGRRQHRPFSIARGSFFGLRPSSRTPAGLHVSSSCVFRLRMW